MSNGVEVLVKDKNHDSKQEQRKFNFIHESTLQPHISTTPTKQLLSSAVATVVSRQQISALYPLHHLMQHNYIIKTCMTTYTYLTTVVHNKRSAISTFETIVSVVTTESLTNLYDSDVIHDLKPTKTKYMEVKTIKPSAATNMYMSNYPKIDKRIDSEEENSNNFDIIQPSEASNLPCTSSCSCSHTKTEGLKTKYTYLDSSGSTFGTKTKFGATKLDLKPTSMESLDKKTHYAPYEYESNTNPAPTDTIVEKYTEVINDYSDEKDSNSVEESELLTNEQAPTPPKINKVSTKLPEKSKPDKPQKPNKNKFVVADLLKLGSLGIKGLSQLAPVLEKMTGGFIRRHDAVNKTTSTTVKPAAKLTAYNMNKRVDSDLEAKHTNFPIYIPVDELDTAESQTLFTNATLHQNLAWAFEHKQPKAHIVLPKIVHESPLVNGGIPISPGEIITANSDVIVGKPAVGGPLTLAASGIKLQNSVKPPPIDSFLAANEHYAVNEVLLNDQPLTTPVHADDSFDLRPPEPPKQKLKPNRPMSWPKPSYNIHNMSPNDQYPYRMPSSIHDQLMKTEQIKTTVLGNHGRPAFLDYIPSLGKPTTQENIDIKANEPIVDVEVSDNSPSSSEVVNTKITTNGDYSVNEDADSGKPFLVDIQPSRVANVLIPHGSSTALVFAGSSEPHKTGDYIDDPLPYPEPGYFGSFSIDAPQMTNVHNVAPTRIKQTVGKPNVQMESNYKPTSPIYEENSVRNDLKIKWNDNKRPIDYNKIPPPTSNQETHVQVGPEITVYNPDIYNPSNDDFNKYKQFNNKDKRKDGKNIIDKDYENYLAVPPPPQPPKTFFNKDVYDKSKPYSQRPIVHTKPVQDMKVFLNIQHPVPEQLPPKVTSEIYFAAQIPNNKPTPTYTIQIPSSPQNINSHQSSNMQPPKFAGHNNGNTFSIVSSPNIANVTESKSENNYKDNSYSVTLNTATNVLSNSDAGQVVGSSISVPIGNSNSDTNNQLNTNIPIGTNFAIRVEDSSTPLENFNLQGHQTPNIIYSEHSLLPHVPIGDNRWNKSSADNSFKVYNYHSDNYGNNVQRKPTNSNAPQSINSHANFPMMNENITPISDNNNVKPVTEYTDNIKSSDIARPAKLIPNIPTNSHGWYSSMLNENKINNIKVEATTRKIIPLMSDLNGQDKLPNFGQKITSVGKPPTEFWSQSSTPIEVNNNKPSFIIGKPFTKQRPSDIIPSTEPPFTSKPYTYKYIPSNFGGVRQPTYDIPIRDNSEETTTLSPKATTEKVKPVYETSEEIYDGEEEGENPGDIDGEISSESMKIPIVSASKEVENVSSTSTETTLLMDEVIKIPNKNNKEDETKLFVNFNPGTQTEKPFGSHNKTMFQSNAIKPLYENINYNKPRPFKINPAIVLDHQLQQPHWQINQMMENVTNMSYEDNFDLNIGEELDKPNLLKPTSTSPKPKYTVLSEVKYQRPPRPNFSRPNNSNIHNESIITSTVHIQDKKPLIIENETEKPLPTFTLSNVEINRSSSEIIDLSPPPPTMDYNFKPSTNDEMIMGMSPPPPRNPPGIRVPARVSMTPRTPVIPIRTPPPYKAKPSRLVPTRATTQRPVRRPINRDEVSTYRPAYDIQNNVRRPIYNRDQPSLQLLPPPRDLPSKAVSPVKEMVTPTTDVQVVPNVVFPTPISSGWLTSSGIDFSSSFNFNSNSVQFPETPQSQKFPVFVEKPSENSFSYEASSEENHDTSSEKSVTEDRFTDSKESSSESTTTEKNVSNSGSNESSQASQEESSTSDVKIIVGNKNRTRKPYPVRNDEKKTVTSKYKLPLKPTPIIKPTKTFSRPEILYPTRHTSIKKIVRPVTRTPTISPTIIESSEQPVDEDSITPTETLKDNIQASISQPESSINNFNDLPNDLPSITSSLIEKITIKPTHHAGNEVKISDEILPTKTEFRTTVVTLTKTLSEPPLTVSSIGYVNLTHTLTVTATKTSLVSQSEGAVTQTLVLTNTQTSTIVDVVTEVHTQVQPTTIIETVTKHIPIQVQPTPVQDVLSKTKIPLDDLTMSSEENENQIIKDSPTTEKPIQKIENEPEPENDSDTFFVVMNKSQNGGQSPPIAANDVDADYDITRNEQVNNNGVSQVLFGEILLAGTPFLETTNLNPNGVLYNKECQPDCKASRNERCQRIDGLMKCVCRPGFARMFPDRPCKPTYTYSVKLALGSRGSERLEYHKNLSDNSSKEYHALAVATHEGINRMVMQSDLRDVYHGVHITGFDPVDLRGDRGDMYKGVMNHFYVQLSDNAHESRLKEVVEKYLRNNNYSLGGTEVYAASGLMDKLDVSDFDECVSGQFHDCSEHAQCFNLRGTYTCSCLEGFADLSVNTLYPGRICSAEPVGCERCNYHGACYSRDDRRVLCECFQWYSGSSCQINLKVVLISLVVCGALLTAVLAVCAVLACSKRRRPPHPQRSIVACIQGMPSIHQGAMPSKQRADRRALISERGESGDTSSMQNASLPYIPAKKASSCKKTIMSDPPAHDPPPPPAPAVMIPRARLHPHHSDSRENIARKRSIELSNEAKLISYLESGVASPHDEMRRKHSLESSYSANKDRHKQGALVSAGFKVSTTIRPDEAMMKDDRDSLCSVNKGDLEAELSRYDAMRKSYSQEDMSEWTDAERRLGELTLSEARSVGGTLPASTGRAASSTRLTHQTSDVSEFDSL